MITFLFLFSFDLLSVNHSNHCLFSFVNTNIYILVICIWLNIDISSIYIFFFFLVDLFWMNPIDFVFIIYVIYYIKTMTKFAQNRKRRRKHFICRESGLFFSKNRFSRFFPKKTQKKINFNFIFFNQFSFQKNNSN